MAVALSQVASLPFHEWAALRAELIWIYDRKVLPEYLHIKGESLPGYRAWLIRRGTLALTTASRTITAGAGTWVMLPQARVAQDFSADAHILSLNFECQWPSGQNVLTNKEGFCLRATDRPELERTAKKMERRLRRQFPQADERERIYTHQSSDYTTFLYLQGLFFNWLSIWFDLQMKYGARLTRLSSGDSRPFQAARCLDQAPLTGGFPLRQLQEQTGLGLMRINQLFFAEFGLTTKKYWDRRRLVFARQCLETSPMPIKEISYRLGFRYDSHFVVWFRRLAGTRPGEYRRRYLEQSK